MMKPILPMARQLDLALDSQRLQGLTPDQRADVLIALATMLREAVNAGPEVLNDDSI